MNSSLFIFLKDDLKYWSTFYCLNNNVWGFIILFIKYPEYRVVVKTRLKAHESITALGGVFFLLRCVISMLSKSHNLYIYTEPDKIGKRLFFHHGFSSMVSAESIGDDVHIYQQVTVGNGKGGTPKIGNNVYIYPGAKVFGGITIGDDVIIGANSVVMRDVPSHSVVVGVPGIIIKRRKDISQKWEKIEKNENNI